MATGSTESPLSQIPMVDGDQHSATFQLEDEDHTLGNALRFAICRNPAVKFCGYSLPHPNQRQVLIQIQVWPEHDVTPLGALEKGLEDLKDFTQSLKTKFQESH